ncbi:hypothetical protein [uncultured Tenacibaculum sp.]|uniref:hypothetical protein n=1 Tax=uncultured Tenacibaculum sp. TaxID=174713 RepID=UPI00261BD896|nr:hypothetical protein [uncultured Tenacibaculum sp.]
MKKSVISLGKTLTNAEQKQINGSGLNNCSNYFGPFSFDENSCNDYHQLPEKYKACVLVDFSCFL